MSLNFGASDFIALVDLANRVRKRFKDAPVQFRAITEDVKTLSNVLRDIDDYEPEESLDMPQLKSLNSVSRTCLGVLEEVGQTLDKYQELAGDRKSHSLKGFSIRVWKGLKWDQGEIDDFRSRINASTDALNLLLTGINSHTAFQTRALVHFTNQRVEYLVRHQDQEKIEKIFDWLSPINPAAKQADLRRGRQQGTGQWFLETQCFQQWIEQSQHTVKDQRTLFCPGIPGAGKTLLASTIVDELQRRFGPDRSIGLSFFYCDFRERVTLEAILGCLLKQLVHRLPVIPEPLEDLYDDHLETKTRASLGELIELLGVAASRLSKTFIVVDALDECRLSSGTLMTLLDNIFGLQKSHNVGFLATSRDYPDIAVKFHRNPCVKIRADPGDIERFLRGQMNILPNFVQQRVDLQEEIILHISQAVDGMFLLARLHLDSLQGKMSPKKIINELHTLPAGLDAAYEEAIKRIESQMPDQSKTAKDALSWIVCAARPLTPLELQHALGIEIGEPCLDEENLPEIQDIVSVCAGLVAIDEQSHVVRLAHYTTQEYLTNNWATLFPDAHYLLGASCVTYLAFDAFQSGFTPSPEEFESRLDEYPLYSYSALNWSYHIKSQDMQLELAMGLLSDKQLVTACSQALLIENEPRNASQRMIQEIRGLHLAAYLGLDEAAKAIAIEELTVDIHDGLQRTPLSWMAEIGRDGAVELLLGMGANPNCTDIDGRTPLSYAVLQGRESVVARLRNHGVRMDSKDRQGRTPLVYAIWGGHETIVDLLLGEGIDVNGKDEHGKTPLIHAIQHSFGGRFETNTRVAIVETLLQKGPDLNCQDKAGQSALAYAVQDGKTIFVKMLLEAGASFENEDSQGLAPLAVAVGRGYEDVVQVLLEWDADPESEDQDGYVPLSASAQRGHTSMVRILLEGGADPNLQDKFYGKTALSYAAWNGYLDIVEMLLQRGADPNRKDIQARTALSWAAEYGHCKVVEALLDHSTQTACDEDLCHLTPLDYAVSKGRDTVVELFHSKGYASVTSKPNLIGPPAHLEVSQPYETAFKSFQIEDI
ncbi:uncharacterized protein N7482_006580 [Penicillium canariense]|uniref:NACHT domain-containing protein n=1 Tax=Penicillium canariense TaxID=189055 RepID=A0A9W9HXU9_9EURO|nr:uncharacterized protein N7482_006580 [Penicillium canariense]KAJ5159576.1 hypothetical protein N7482_006580 [Penicillium canariense]